MSQESRRGGEHPAGGAWGVGGRIENSCCFLKLSLSFSVCWSGQAYIQTVGDILS